MVLLVVEGWIEGLLSGLAALCHLMFSSSRSRLTPLCFPKTAFLGVFRQRRNCAVKSMSRKVLQDSKGVAYMRLVFPVPARIAHLLAVR